MLPTIEPGIKVAVQASPEPSEEELALIEQMGVEWVVLWTNAAKASADYFASRRKLYEAHGIRVYGFGNWDVHNQDAIVLGLEGRDAKVAQYKQHLRDLSRAGIPYTTYAHMANGIWSTEPEPVRGGAPGRAFRLDRAREGWWIDKQWPLPLSHGRAYTEDELWENYAYFIRQVAPVAEEAGVYIGIHPDDPPVYPLGGIPRCIFGNFEGYRRAIELADSPNIGVCLCLGCWLEGGPAMGKSAVETIRYFGGQRKLFKVHFRNVTAPMPEGFVETFLDDGYGDMLAIMAALQEVGFTGAIISDHLQQVIGGRRAAEAYAVGYMRGLIQAAEARIVL